MCKETQSKLARKNWENTIMRVIKVLNKNNIQYHIDASSSLYIHGVEFTMDDLDITVAWGTLSKVVDIFKNYNPTKVTLGYPPSTKFQINNHIVHIMSYQSESGIGEADDRTIVNLNGVDVWSKTIGFYQKHMGSDHKLNVPLQNYLDLHRP